MSKKSQNSRTPPITTPSGELPTVWHAFNLREGPFFQETLAGSVDHGYPADLFVGRQRETERMLRVIGSGRSSRQMVGGAPGIGKTTLVQHVKQRAISARYLSYPEAVSVGMADATDRLLERILAYTYETLLSHDTERAIINHESMQTARQVVRAFRDRQMGGELSILGVGGGITTATAYNAPMLSTALVVPSLLGELVALAEQALQARGIILHLNNLENLSAAERERAGLILRDLRDLMLAPGYHYIVVGTADALSTVISAHPQLRSVFGFAEVLEPLSLKEVTELLKRRYAYLRFDPDRRVRPPVAPDAVEELYTLFRGDLRGMLRALEQAATHLIGYGEPALAPMSRDDVRRVLHSIYLLEMHHCLPETVVKHVLTLGGNSEKLFTQKELAHRWRASQSWVSDVLADLQRFGYIELGERQGRQKTYRLAGAGQLVLSVATDEPHRRSK